MKEWIDIYSSVSVCVHVHACVCACMQYRKECLKNSDEKTGIHRWKAFGTEVMIIQGPILRVFEKWVMKIHGPTGSGCLRNKYTVA